ncbi:glucokinase [Rhodanobacter fulvus Jip2]|uniref:Glucokinase n=2 Tax=Rhodanobacter TaxID=75309 RepID=I4VUW8_9GAMM|nr:glucokinase [Rhodanobacter fulvus Jip2]
MGEVVNQRHVMSPSTAADHRVAPFLAADVGGTHARIALVAPAANRRQPIDVLHYRRYQCAAWPSLTAVLRDFVEQLPGVALEQAPAECAVACAGYVLGDAIVNENLPWPVSIGDIRQSLGIKRIAVINDFEALAYATQFVDQADTRAVIDAIRPTAPGPVLVMGPGTGLGSAVLMPGEPHAHVLATEAGQISLAPGTERERQVLPLLAHGRDYVSYENALSGPGLLNLYRALCSLHRTSPAATTPADVTAAALAGEDPAAVEALDMFCGLLGSFVGDLVMLYGARGGVYLAGGILPQIHGFLASSTFAERYFNKGVMRAYLQQVPVRLIEHGQLGVMGAAGWFLEERRNT